ncbi:hypothetical protein C8263_13100 [Deinococcus arcticus]|uniref:Secreted protein n=1 Tax=Deinococcus arcticus TaxID=2136176 RepID=A0A2T3W5S2_9DEIO|nr:hypothetical protein C8263_13100 [Deinococcus arcticus]
MKRVPVIALALRRPALALAATLPVQVPCCVVHCTCTGQNLSVSYAKFGTQSLFAVLEQSAPRPGTGPECQWGALHQSVRAGARGRLRWWEHQGQATLNAFTGNSTVNTDTDCRPFP